jgi:hypothetical protein
MMSDNKDNQVATTSKEIREGGNGLDVEMDEVMNAVDEEMRNTENNLEEEELMVSSSIMRVLRPTHLLMYCRQIFLLFASLSLAVFIPLLCGCWWSFTKVCFCGVIWVAIY